MTLSGLGTASGGRDSADYRTGVGVGGSTTAGGNGLIVLRTVTPAASAAPEPGTLSLVGMGLVSGIGTLGIARKRRKNAAV